VQNTKQKVNSVFGLSGYTIAKRSTAKALFSDNTECVAAASGWDFARMQPGRFEKRAFVNGFPGSGNVILRRLASDLLKSNPDYDAYRPSNPSATADLPLHVFQKRHNLLLKFFRTCTPEQYQDCSYFSIHRGGGQVDFFIISNDRPLFAGPIDLGVHLSSNFASHEIPTKHYYDLYESYGLHILPIVRHPLDTLASVAHKEIILTEIEITRIQAEHDPKAKTALSKEFRRRSAAIRLQSDTWLRLAGAALSRFLTAHNLLNTRWPVLRYEDLIADPTQFVANLSRRLNVDADHKTQRRCAQMVGTKVLAPDHFTNPSSGKWKRLFAPRQIDLLAETGLFGVAATLGYPPPSYSDLQTANSPFILENQTIDVFRLLQITLFFQLFEPEWVAEMAGIEDQVFYKQAGMMRLVSASNETMDAFYRRLQLAIV
jgi:hypothetical protein